MIGIVLAGGQSSRMGEDKAMLTVGGEVLLARQLKLLHEASVKSTVVSGNYPSYECIHDNFKDIGPIGGIEAAMTKFPTSTLLFVPIDLPLLSPSTLLNLMSHLEHHDAVAYDHAWLPLGLSNTLEQRAVISQLCEAHGDLSIRNLCKQLGAYIAPRPDTHCLFNTNTPDEWQRSLKLQQGALS